MKFNQTHLLIGIVAVLAVVAFVVLTSAPGPYDDFAQCLTENDAKMYGAFWCPHCKEQKAMFGSSWKYVSAMRSTAFMRVW